MKANDKKRIQELREAGLTYKEIADETGIAFGTVKMFFQRQKDKPAVQRCEQCRRPLRQDVFRTSRRFCSDTCRAKWWETHPEKLSQPGTISLRVLLAVGFSIPRNLESTVPVLVIMHS